MSLEKAPKPTPPAPQPEEPVKQATPEQRWRAAANDLSKDNWQLFVEMARTQSQGKFNDLFKTLEESGLQPLEVNEKEGTIGLPLPTRQLLVKAMEGNHDFSALFEKLTKEVEGHVRMKFLVSMLYPDSPQKTKALEMIEDGAKFKQAFYNFNLLEQTGKMDYGQLRKRVGRLDFPRLINQENTYNKQVSALNLAYQKKMGAAQPKPKNPAEMKQMLDNIAKKPDNAGRYQAGGKDHYFFYGKGNPNKGPLTTFWLNPRLEQTEAVFKIIDSCLAGQDAQAKFHDESFLDQAANPASRPDDKIVIYFGGDDHKGVSTFLERLSEKREEIQDLLEPEDFRSLMESFRIPVIPGVSFVERDIQDSWDTNTHLLLKHDRYFGTLMDKWWARAHHTGKQPIKPTELQYRSASEMNDGLGAKRAPKMPGLRKS